MPYHSHGPLCPSIESIVCTLVKKPCNSLALGSHMLGRLGCFLAFVRGVMPLLPLHMQMSPGAHLRYTCTLSWLARWLTHRASSSTLHRLICSCTRPHGTSSRALLCWFQVDYNCHSKHAGVCRYCECVTHVAHWTQKGKHVACMVVKIILERGSLHACIVE
jgi:hypothetical protein